jgi:hypothetical protein
LPYPADLREVATDGLPISCCRTYTNGAQSVQFFKGADRVTTVISTMYVPLVDVDMPRPTLGDYKTARYLFNHETPATLVRMFNFGDEWLQKSKEEVIYHRSGWKVLRPETEQGDSGALTYDAASKMTVHQLKAVHKAHLKLRREAKLTKPKLLEALFPDEAMHHEQAAAEEDRRRKGSKAQAQDLNALLQEVRGSLTARVGPSPPLH